MVIEVGRVCIKRKGREIGKKCVIVDIIDDNFVLIDGNVKRRKCNIDHLEPTSQKLEIEKGAPTEQVKEAMAKSGLLEEQKVSKIKKRERKKSEKPKKEEKKSKAKKKTEEEIVEEALVKV